MKYEKFYYEVKAIQYKGYNINDVIEFIGELAKDHDPNYLEIDFGFWVGDYIVNDNGKILFINKPDFEKKYFKLEKEKK